MSCEQFLSGDRLPRDRFGDATPQAGLLVLFGKHGMALASIAAQNMRETARAIAAQAAIPPGDDLITAVGISQRDALDNFAQFTYQASASFNLARELNHTTLKPCLLHILSIEDA